MGSDAFRSLFVLYQSKTRVSTHVNMVTHLPSGGGTDVEASSADTAALAALSFATSNAQVTNALSHMYCTEYVFCMM